MFKKLSIVSAGIILGALCVVLPATPAAASTVYCDSTLTEAAESGKVVVPAHAGSYKCYLFEGDGPNAGVKALQHTINLCYLEGGYLGPFGVPSSPKLTEDGQFGAKTKAALVAVQKEYNSQDDENIDTDGSYGPQTYNSTSFATTSGNNCSLTLSSWN